MGVGQDCFDGSHVDGGAKADLAVELAGSAGWICGNDEGVLVGRVAASGAPFIGQKILTDY